MTKDIEEFSEFTVSVSGREHTTPRDANISDPKGWIRGNTKIGPVLEVTTSYLQATYGVQIRIELQLKTSLTRGSEFLMTCISWSRT